MLAACISLKRQIKLSLYNSTKLIILVKPTRRIKWNKTA